MATSPEVRSPSRSAPRMANRAGSARPWKKRARISAATSVVICSTPQMILLEHAWRQLDGQIRRRRNSRSRAQAALRPRYPDEPCFEHHVSTTLRLAGGSSGVACGAAFVRGHPGRRRHPHATQKVLLEPARAHAGPVELVDRLDPQAAAAAPPGFPGARLVRVSSPPGAAPDQAPPRRPVTCIMAPHCSPS